MRRTRRAVFALFTALVLAFAASRADAQSQDMRLQLLNGKTGRPITSAHVTLWRDTNHATLDGSKTNAAVVTDGEGYAPIPNTDSQFAVVYVEGHQLCSKTFKRTFVLADVRSRGVVSENSCRVHIHMYPQAGTLIVFARPLGFIEKRMRKPE